ncbi:mitochondrial import receptor subunit TOM5-like protein [Senna tora]|uniref:Mitochondrial import receptor subunit TOM5-like protein n=1 Tax=Senna tora TaxID=362788 RepID=A0A834W6W0_9FABA|nr:mitochondrial import receptor subunit TOM5-like protein [Senna tora]
MADKVQYLKDFLNSQIHDEEKWALNMHQRYGDVLLDFGFSANNGRVISSQKLTKEMSHPPTRNAPLIVDTLSPLLNSHHHGQKQTGYPCKNGRLIICRIAYSYHRPLSPLSLSFCIMQIQSPFIYYAISISLVPPLMRQKVPARRTIQSPFELVKEPPFIEIYEISLSSSVINEVLASVKSIMLIAWRSLLLAKDLHH